MSWGAIGAMFAALVIIFIIANAWFHIVEGTLGGLKRLFCRKKPTAWHPLPQEQEKEREQE